MNRRVFLRTLATATLSAPIVTEGQQAGKMYRVGFLDANGTIPRAFLDGLETLGWVEGVNIVFERRAANSVEGVRQVAVEFVRLGVDLIAVPSAGWAEQMLSESKTIPIVLWSAGELGSSGLVASLTRPGGNVTGMQIYSPELMGKRLQILRDVVPRLTRVVVLRGTPYPPKLLAVYQRATDEAARVLGIAVRYVEFRAADDLPEAFSGMTKARTEALLVWANPATTSNRTQILKLAVAHHLPTMCEHGAYTDALVVYGPKLEDVFREAATYVDQIFKGANPGDLPIGQPRTFQLTINLKTARALGLTIPPSLLQRADQVIE